jgi:adenine-specific DNA-methyltransferase
VSFYGWNRIDAFFRFWRQAGFYPVEHIVWAKNYASSRGFLEARHEQAYLLAKGRPAKPALPIADVREWEYSGNRAHPTEKAVSVLKPLIEAFSRPGDLVLDPFSGSGSTSAAAPRGRSISAHRQEVSVLLDHGTSRGSGRSDSFFSRLSGRLLY